MTTMGASTAKPLHEPGSKGEPSGSCSREEKQATTLARTERNPRMAETSVKTLQPRAGAVRDTLTTGAGDFPTSKS